MSKFLKKTFVFALPFTVLYLITYLFYESNKGDILRVGYVPNKFPSYRDKFISNYNKPKNFTLFSENPMDLKFDIMTIGDSFSEQGVIGYQNFLATDYGFSLLHFESKFHQNPIQTLISLTNGDFFDKYEIKVIVLQSVERNFVVRGQNIKRDSVLNSYEIYQIKKNRKLNEKIGGVSNRIFKFPYFAISRSFNPDQLYSKIYQWKLDDTLFSVPDRNLLFWYSDLNNIEYNETEEFLQNLNSELNFLALKLKTKGIELIILPAPNKYTYYYKYLEMREQHKRPIFFQKFSMLEKDYYYIEIDTEKNKNIIDFYFYDDTHWSPVGAKVVADKINQILEEI